MTDQERKYVSLLELSLGQEKVFKILKELISSEDVSKWVTLKSDSIEDKLKVVISQCVESFMNGVYDQGVEEYVPMTLKDWSVYLEASIQQGYYTLDNISPIQVEKMISIYGFSKYLKLLETYLRNYIPCIKYGVLKS